MTRGRGGCGAEVSVNLWDDSSAEKKTTTKKKKTCEPRHDKTNKVTVRPAKTQISLGIRPV